MSPLWTLLAVALALPVTLHDPRTESDVTIAPGFPTHVVFLATWCPECVAELPRLAELEERWGSRGYRLVLVAVRTRQDPARLRAFEEERTVPGTLVWDRNGEFAASLGVESLPTHILLGTDGVERGRWPKLGSGLEEAVEAAVVERER